MSKGGSLEHECQTGAETIVSCTNTVVSLMDAQSATLSEKTL